MNPVRLRSVRQKLLLIVLLANIFALAAAGSALLYHDLNEYRKTTAAALTTLASILAQGSAVALDFDDVDVAQENLALLEANPSIVVGAIFTSDGELFARYGDDNYQHVLPSPPLNNDSFQFRNGELIVSKQIGTPSGVVGSVYLVQQFNLATWLSSYLTILAIILALSLGLSLFISTRLQRWVSVPIEAISRVARQVTVHRNYQLRATKITQDEIGQLADDFNGMLNTLEHEIAERTAAEQEVRQFNMVLEQRVEQRTTELQIANEHLIARTEEAESANRAKAAFLANMSHEIRTPMNAILGLAYLLDQSELDADSADLVRKIRNAGRSLQSIINDILDLSKIDAERLEIEHVPFDIAEVIDNLVSITAANLGAKEIELIVSPAPDINGQLIGDALRLEQVLINLVGNAIKFTERGSIVVDIQKVAEHDKHVDLRFSIKDTGIGIPPENQAQIFSAFSQADVSTTRRFGGTGLGLTICRHLVKLMGGDIGVNSEPDKGSEFWFTVPLDVVPDGEKNKTPAKLDILIVDSNPLASENLERIVQSLGWSGKRALAGEIAVQQLQEKKSGNEKFDAILIDWKLDDGTGLDVARMIQKAFKDDLPPIILMMPTFARDETPVISGNISSVLNKPVTSSSLYNIIGEVLQPHTKQHSQEKTKQNKIKRLAGLHVLVVDDNAVNREVAMRFLTSEGAEVSVAEDGKMAVEWITTNLATLDLVLMDVQMPVMDGYEATRHLRSRPECAKLPIIALTAGVFETQIDAARDAGMNTVVTKPFNIDDLVNAILHLGILKFKNMECLTTSK